MGLLRFLVKPSIHRELSPPIQTKHLQMDFSPIGVPTCLNL